MSKTPKISVIIPCYNAAKTIGNTLESLNLGNHSSIQIIIVDDGSTDCTKDMLGFYIEKYNIEYVKKSNGGVSSARNLGLEKAMGEYVYFLDSDDTINSELFQKVRTSNEDMIVFGYRHERNKKWINFIPEIQSDYLRSYSLGDIYIHMCSFMIKRSVLNDYNIRFDETTYYAEDTEFITKCIYYSRSFKVLRDPYFNYNLNEESAMHTPTYTFKQVSAIRAMQRLYKMFENHPRYNKIFLMKLQMEVILQLRDYKRKNCEDPNIMLDILQYENILKLDSGFKLNRYWGYVYIMRWLYWHNKSLFNTMLSII